MELLSCLGRYRISLIRCRGYSFFHCMLLCGYIFEGGYYCVCFFGKLANINNTWIRYIRATQ